MVLRSTTSRLAFIRGTSSQPISCPRHHSQGLREKASRKFSVPRENSMVREITRTRFLGGGSTTQSRLPSRVAIPAQELTIPSTASPPLALGRISAGRAASKAEATKFTPARKRMSRRIILLSPRYRSPERTVAKKGSRLSLAPPPPWGRRTPSSSARNATPKVSRSRKITPSIPAKANTAVARMGLRMVTRELDRERRPLVFWYHRGGVISVMATSLAGCCTVFIRPLRAFNRYMCQGASQPPFSRTSTATEESAARLSQASMVFFLSHRSLRAPAKMLITT